MRIIKVKTANVLDGSYRNTWKDGDNLRPKAFEQLFQRLKDRVLLGDELAIHVAITTPWIARVLGDYTVLDGHVSLDVYRSLKYEEVEVIIHDNITTEAAARIAYISRNYLRSSDWLRDSLQFRDDLIKIGKSVSQGIVEDPALAVALIERKDEQWQKFESVFADDPANPLDEMYS